MNRNILKYHKFILLEKYNKSKDTRSVTLNLNEEEIIKYLTQRVPWYMNNLENITPIYRGIIGDRYKQDDYEYNKIMTINPSNFIRRSKNTDNLYIEILDNSPHWEEYPKRSKSIICTTSKNKASIYGEIYRIIPIEENSKMGLASNRDIFESFRYFNNKMKEITNINFYGIQ